MKLRYEPRFATAVPKKTGNENRINILHKSLLEDSQAGRSFRRKEHGGKGKMQNMELQPDEGNVRWLILFRG